MNKLIAQLQRLYFFDDQQWHSQKLDAGGTIASYPEKSALTPAIVAKSLTGEANLGLNLINPRGMVRAMVINFKRAGDWDRVANLYQSLEDELDLPAPAISVSGQQGYRLWFSLAEPLPAAQASLFLNALGLNYLTDLPLAHFELCPGNDNGQAVTELVPALHLATGKWSAFIDPRLGGMFIDEPGLEMAPNMVNQAGILASLKSIKAEEFQRALSTLQMAAEADSKGAEAASDLQSQANDLPALDTKRPRSMLKVGEDFRDPQSFLLAVINDSSASAGQRIKAAKALLPYFANSKPE